jgi:hypothetical protein
VTLRNVEPPVWRRIVVPSEFRLDKVNSVLEAAMGWYGDHLHSFATKTTTYVSEQMEQAPYGPADDVVETKAKLSDALPRVRSKMLWNYDFGDGWEHDVVCEAIAPRDAKDAYPQVIGGEHACPPEDCGGPWGYAELLEALGDRKHKQHKELKAWIGGEFDPSHFDLPAHDAAVRTTRANW